MNWQQLKNFVNTLTSEQLKTDVTICDCGPPDCPYSRIDAITIDTDIHFIMEEHSKLPVSLGMYKKYKDWEVVQCQPMLKMNLK
jgi:hypothetical protein